MKTSTVVLPILLLSYFPELFCQTGNIITNATNVTNSTNNTNVEDTYLFQTSLHLNYGNYEFICGGSIVSSNLVLTLASCMYYSWGGLLPPLIVTVAAGRNNLSDTPLEEYEVEKIIFHTGYNDATLEYNLALVQIKRSFTFNARVNTALVKSSSTNALSHCYVTGWNNVSKNLQAVQVNVVRCSTINLSSVVCTQTTLTNETICNHHLGSSLVCNGELVGVLSIEPSCSVTNQTAVFERISTSIKWLKDNNAFSSTVATSNHGFILSKYGFLIIVSFICSILLL